jgi:hypothetical protein
MGIEGRSAMTDRQAHRLLACIAAIVAFSGLGAAAPTGRAGEALSGWTIQASPALSGGELLGVSALSASDAWAVGTRAVNGVFSPLAEHWNGSTWSQASMPAPGTFNELYAVTMVSTADVWAVGVSANWSGLIEHWNGSAWKVVPSPVTGPQTPLYGVKAFAANDVWAVGENGAKGTILHWNGATWSNVSHPEPAGSALTAFQDIGGVSATNIWAVGEASTTTQQPLVEHYNGTRWKIVPSAQQGSYNYVRGLSVRRGSDAWFVGDWQESGPAYTEHPLVQHWNGSAWSAISTNVGEPWDITALTASDAWLVGSQPSRDGDYTTLLEHWNGTSWSVVPGPSTGGDSELNGIASLSTRMVWAVGSYSPTGIDQPLIEVNQSG